MLQLSVLQRDASRSISYACHTALTACAHADTCKQMAITAADLPSTDITAYFNAAFVFIEEALDAKHGVLIHCGAGTSRSAALCAAYLMRKQRVGAKAALEQLLALRSSVCPNEGFWQQLCAFEQDLGLPPGQQSDVRKPPVVNESYGQEGAAPAAAQGAAGSKVAVKVTKGSVQLGEAAAGARVMCIFDEICAVELRSCHRCNASCASAACALAGPIMDQGLRFAWLLRRCLLVRTRRSHRGTGCSQQCKRSTCSCRQARAR